MTATVPLHHLCLVDGSGYIFRAFHAIQPMTRPDGTPVNAVYGFTRMLMKLIQELKADHFAVIFDAGRATFRNEIYPEYKAHRPDPPEELIPQFALVREATRAIGMPAIELAGFEADDLIATYARLAVERGAKVTIVSSDKDLMQLVGNGVTMLDPIKERPIGPDEVREKFGVGPEHVIDVQALAGDPTDNVPGVPGIGVKTAAQLIEEYGDLDTLLARAGEIKQPKRRETLLANADAARISRDLVRLKNDVPVPAALEAFVVRPPDREVLLAFLDAQGFRSIRARVTGEGGVAAIKTESADHGVAASQPAPVPASPVKPAGPAQYELVLTEAALKRWIAEATAAGMLAVDTETDSLDPMRANLVGVSLAIVPGRACYIPVRHDPVPKQGALDLGGTAAKDAPKLIPAATTLALLKPLLEDPSILKIGHNIKFDMKVFARAGIEVEPVDDTLVLSFDLEGSSHGHGMDELSDLHLGHKTITYEEVCGSGKNQITFDRVPLDKATDYAGRGRRGDAAPAPAVQAAPARRAHGHGLRNPRPAADPRAVRHGARRHQGRPRRARADERRIRPAHGRSRGRNPKPWPGRNSMSARPNNWARCCSTSSACPAARKAPRPAPMPPAPTCSKRWRRSTRCRKKCSTGARSASSRAPMPMRWSRRSIPRTGRVHTSYGLAGASTGRLSSNDPNLQNIPIRTEEGRRIRKAFIADQGHVLISADYSQIELRLVAHVADIDGLKRAFAEGADIHAITASQVFGIPVDGMDPMVRRRAKAINFGIIYGISAFGLAAQLGIPAGRGARPISTPISPNTRRSAPTWNRPRRRRGAQGYVETLVRAQMLRAGHQGQEPGHARLLGTGRDQRADPGRRGRHHQARHGAPARPRWPRRTARRACCSRCMTNWCSKCRKARPRKPLRWSRR